MVSSITMTGHRGPAHAVDVVVATTAPHERCHIDAPISIEHSRNALFRNADQHDRLVMLQQPGAADHALHVDGDQDMDGFAGKASRIDEIGVEKNVADLFFSGEGGCNRRLAADRTDPVGAGECSCGARRSRKPCKGLAATAAAPIRSCAIRTKRSTRGEMYNGLAPRTYPKPWEKEIVVILTRVLCSAQYPLFSMLFCAARFQSHEASTFGCTMVSVMEQSNVGCAVRTGRR